MRIFGGSFASGLFAAAIILFFLVDRLGYIPFLPAARLVVVVIWALRILTK